MAQSTHHVEDQTTRTDAEAWNWPDGPARRAALGHQPERHIPGYCTCGELTATCLARRASAHEAGRPEWAEYYELRGDRIRHGYGTTDVLSVRDDVIEGVSVELWQETNREGGDRRAPLVEFAGLTLDVHQARKLAALLTELCDLAAADSSAPWPGTAPDKMVWLDACGPLTRDEREQFVRVTSAERDTLLSGAYNRLTRARAWAGATPTRGV